MLEKYEKERENLEQWCKDNPLAKARVMLRLAEIRNKIDAIKSKTKGDIPS